MKNSMKVFVSYRGDELRYNFVSHLSDAFERNGINFFIDIFEQRGKDLKNIFVRIQESNIALPIFSTRYAESEWCMDELVEIKKLVDEEQLQVIPIFYKVEAEDVKNQTEGSEFGDNFWKLARSNLRLSSGDKIMKWIEALKCISHKMGLSLKDKSSEADFINEIVKEVKRVIKSINQKEEEQQIHFGKKRRNDMICTCPYQLPHSKKSKFK
ncbi:unnamed protein product [Cochlearia groenlandica]